MGTSVKCVRMDALLEFMKKSRHYCSRQLVEYGLEALPILET